MKKVAFAVAFATLLGGSALASDDLMSNTYDNTVVVKNAKGEISKIHFDADKNYTTTLADGKTIKGTWALAENDSKICYTQTDPAPAPEATTPACAPFLGKKDVGSTWEQAGTTGENVTVELVAGR